MFTITPDKGFSWFGDCDGTRPDEIDNATAKTLIRYARENYNCTIEPQITEYVILSETNPYGDDVVATVRYSRNGWVSSVGGSLTDDGHINWTCYAD